MLPLDVENERLLVQRLYARDEQAMALFYKHYKCAIYNVIWRIVQHHELAEDILQESMLKFWLSFTTYNPAKGRLSTWVLNISRNLAIDRLREARYRHAQRTSSLSTAAEHVAATATFEPEHIGVRDWLNLLPASDRELIEVLYFKGHTQVEASQYLQIPLGTVKTRATRIIKTLARVVS
ncbi:MAG: sigma-70 family RNA polymerase sigma factor [Cytophagaceae bacterium]|nr:MAG: sigma-70 family RNA polymerase sigma factor [Cytophagaceae bacterium]